MVVYVPSCAIVILMKQFVHPFHHRVIIIIMIRLCIFHPSRLTVVVDLWWLYPLCVYKEQRQRMMPHVDYGDVGARLCCGGVIIVLLVVSMR